MAPRPPPLPVSLVLVAVGALVCAGFAVAFVLRLGSFNGRAVGVTVPDTVLVRVPGGARTLVSREVAGTHVTVNRPRKALPADLALSVWDAETGATIATAPSSAWVRHNMMGMERHRTGIVSFTAPAHGRVRLAVAGSFTHDEVFAVGPTHDWYMRREGLALVGIAGGGGLLAMTGLGLCVWRVARAPGIDDDAGP